MSRRSLGRGLLLTSILLAGCGRVPPLAHAQGSADALARAVLDALERQDRPGLVSLALDEGEFRNHVWPALPAARAERNVPLSYVWGDLRQKSQLSLNKTLREHGGRRYALAGVSFAGRTEYGAYTVHREAALRVRDASGAERHLRVLGSMVEQGGGWKVFSYVVDD
jgi:hypothetical protein